MRIFLTTLLCTYALLSAAQDSQSTGTTPPAAAREARVAATLYRCKHKSPEALLKPLQSLYADQLKLSWQDKEIVMRGAHTARQEALSLLEQLDHPPQQLHIQLSNNPDLENGVTYSTASRGLGRRSFDIEENETLLLQQGSQARTVGGAGPWWIQVESIPTEQESLQLQVSATDDAVYLQVDLYTLENGQFTRLKRSIRGKPDQWISLSGQPQSSGQQRTYTTGSGKSAALYIKVSKP